MSVSGCLGNRGTAMPRYFCQLHATRSEICMTERPIESGLVPDKRADDLTVNGPIVRAITANVYGIRQMSRLRQTSRRTSSTVLPGSDAAAVRTMAPHYPWC